MYSWSGIDVQLHWQSERTGIENNWYALTGRVVTVKIEADGDLHLALQDASGDKPGVVVVEVPFKAAVVKFVPQFLVGRSRQWAPFLKVPFSFL
jgi:hypothetical protein